MNHSKHPSIMHKALHDAEKRKKQAGNSTMYIILVLLVATLASLLVMATTDKTPLKIPIEKLSYVKKKVSNVFDNKKVGEFKQFESAEDFLAYVEQSSNDSMYYGMGNTFGREVMMVEDLAMPPEPEGDWGLDKVSEVNLGNGAMDSTGGSADRVSETNVQVVGIDEPDIVKTDGEDIYFSNTYYNRDPGPVFWRGDEIARYDSKSAVDIIKAWPPANVELRTAIEESGNLLLSDDVLVIFSNRNIYAYDVSDSTNPEKLWTIKYEDRTYLQAARLYGDEIYLITKNNLSYGTPCPFVPLEFGDTKLSIECTDIYHPIAPVPVDSTFVAMKVDIKTGTVKEDVSFVGAAGSSILYMSKNAMFVTYNHGVDMFTFMADFMTTEADTFLPKDLINKIAKLKTYDISSQSKMTELMTELEKWESSLDRDESLRIENEMQNKMDNYYKANFRSLYKTEIVKIDLEDFDIAADGIVPGYPLNQFALDEYDGHLRIATTIGERGGFWGINSSQDTANDVYVLDEDLKIVGSVIDLGLTERVYSARFIEDKGYIVTFRQTDPFYILDLSNPKEPKMTGELKIPGYSSYLHPLKDNLILGIGKEGSKVKLSLFDVSDSTDPQEINKYMLDEYSSEALNNHHAFMMDAKHEIFFLPGNKGGYVFSYKNDELEMLKAVGEDLVKRAIYLDDYLYVIASESITVLDMKNWVELNQYDIISQ